MQRPRPFGGSGPGRRPGCMSRLCRPPAGMSQISSNLKLTHRVLGTNSSTFGVKTPKSGKARHSRMQRSGPCRGSGPERRPDCIPRMYRPLAAGLFGGKAGLGSTTPLFHLKQYYPSTSRVTIAERTRDKSKGCRDFCPKAKSRIRP